MSQFPNNPYADQSEDMMNDGQKTHGLAIASLVCSLICCIPFLGALGALLGVFGFVKINGDEARFRGKGMAIAGIIIGLVVSLAWIPGVYYGSKFVSYIGAVAEFVEDGVPSALRSGAGGDHQAFVDAFSDSTLSLGDAQAFFAEVETRYGALTSVTIDPNQNAQPQPGQPVVPMGYVMLFEDGDAINVSAELQMADQQATTMSDAFKFGILSITLEDAENGDLTFP